MWGLCASKRHTARQVSVPTQLRPVDCDLGPEQPKSPATGIGRGGGHGGRPESEGGKRGWEIQGKTRFPRRKQARRFGRGGRGPI